MKQIPLPLETSVDLPHSDDGTHVIAPDLAYRRLALVNVIFLGRPGRVTESGRLSMRECRGLEV